MADQTMVTDPVGQQMEQSAAQGAQAIQSQPTPGEGNVAPQANPIQQLQDRESQSVSSGDGTNAQRPKGTLDDQRKEILKRNPNAKLPPTPSQQAQYVQLVTRFMLYIHDTRQHPGMKSPCETCLNQMNNPKLSVAQAVGQATANAMFILYNSAKQQRVKYDANVVFHAADECVPAMYLIGLARGIFQGVPPFKGKAAGKKYPFDHDEIMLMMRAKMYGVQWFGKLMEQSGQITPQDKQAAAQHWQDQIKHEIASGKVTDAQVQALMNHPQIKSQIQDMAPQGAPADQSQPPPQAQPPAQQPPADNGGGVAPPQPPAGAQ